MGHLGMAKQSYKKLVQKLDSYPIGIIADEKVYKFMQSLYTPEEAEIISHMPLQLSNATVVAKATGLPPEEVPQRLKYMAEKGIVFLAEANGETYYAPMWSVPGFIEMTLMKVRDDIPQKELAQVLHDLMKDKKFMQEVFQAETQFGRALIDNKVAETTADIMPYELVTEVVKTAKKLAVVHCYCRHKAYHTGHTCQYPIEVCMSLNAGADFVIAQKFGRPIGNDEGLAIIEQTSSLGLMHIGDNVKNNLGFICNCCECCCGILRGYHDHGIFNTAVASSFEMRVERQKCVGCGKCVPKCQIKAIRMEASKEGDKPRLKAVIAPELCLGCGICYRSCNQKALTLHKRERRVTTPENSMEKMLMMAVERGKLQNMLFWDVYSKKHALLRALTGVILKRGIVKKYLLQPGMRKRLMQVVIDNMARDSDKDLLEKL
jgi:NAD-dependent dihydropyrimidine dehydrogenase PreA subunit